MPIKRPTSVTVFGVLDIVFGVLGLLGTAWSWFLLSSGILGSDPIFGPWASDPFYSVWGRVSAALSAVISPVLIASGIGLLYLKPWARTASIAYGVYGIISALAGSVVSWFYVYRPIMDKMTESAGEGAAGAAFIGGLIGGAIGLAFSLAYPCLLLFFMTRPAVEIAFGVTTVEEGEGFAVPPPEPGADSNPYAPPAAPVYKAATDRTGSVVSTIIPYRNKPALVAYYLGLFSLFAIVPILGVIGIGMAVAAIILGVKGLRLARERPEAKGRVHAWVGVLGGSFFGLIGLLINALMLVGLAAA